MKRIFLCTLMIAVMALPPFSGAQEPRKRINRDGSEIPANSKEAEFVPEPEEEADKRDYKALLKALPVRDKRDIDDRKAHEEYLRKFGATDEYIYRHLSEPRFVKVDSPKAVNQFFVSFTAEASKNVDEEIERVKRQYNIEFVKRYNSRRGVTIYVKCSVDTARQISEDLNIRRVSQDQLLPPPRFYKVPVPKDVEKEQIEKLKRGQTFRSGGQDKQIQKPERDQSFWKDVRINGDWALDMIDSRFEVFDNFYNSTNNAPNGQTYVFDGGVVNIGDHFSGRLRWLPSTEANLVAAVDPDHGTEVASVLASKYIGAAIDHKIVSVLAPTLALNLTQNLRDRLDLIRADALLHRPEYSQVNMSLAYEPVDFGGTIPTILDEAVEDLLNDDIPVIAAIGQFDTDDYPSNSQNYISYWPQRVEGVIKVGMANSTRHRLNMPDSYSPNCTSVGHIRHVNGSDIFAPAGISVPAVTPPLVCRQIGILSADITNNPSYVLGTSFAAPQVSAVLAMYGSLQTTFHPKTWMMEDTILTTATPNVMSGLALADTNAFIYSMVPGNYCRNSASYAEGVARGSLATCFAAYTGQQNVLNLRNDPDPAVSEIGATILSANNFQTNWLVPNAINLGPQIVRTYQGSNQLGGHGFTYIHDVAPGVFSWDSSGGGAGVIQAYYNDKTTGAFLRSENVFAAGTNWNSATENLVLVIFGTGWRYGSNPDILLKKDGNTYPPGVAWFGDGGSPGLDQMNSGNVPAGADGQTLNLELYMNGLKANVVTVKLI